MESSEVAFAAVEPRKDSAFSKRLIISLVLLLTFALLASGLLLFHAQQNSRWRTEALSGRVAMSENQLVDLISSEKVVAYWVGPRPGYLYTVDAKDKNKIILSYVAERTSTAQRTINSRVIATYVSKDAFSNSILAASQPGNSGFRNPDGSVVFYSSKRNTDVYLSFPKKNVQIEIYDSLAGQALSLAILQDQITPIGA
jgi:hypothetical protein